MKFTFTMYAPSSGGFSQDAFSRSTGKTIPVNLPEGGAVVGTFVGAEVSPGGGSVDITLDVPVAGHDPVTGVGNPDGQHIEGEGL